MFYNAFAHADGVAGPQRTHASGRSRDLRYSGLNTVTVICVKHSAIRVVHLLHRVFHFLNTAHYNSKSAFSRANQLLTGFTDVYTARLPNLQGL